MAKLREIAGRYPCVQKVELLPFKKLCAVKYENLKVDFPFLNLPTSTKQQMEELEKELSV